MVVGQALERSPNHFIPEVPGSIEPRDAARQLLHDAQVPATPRHLVTQIQQAACHTCDRSLAAGTRRRDMCLNTSRQIEAHVRRCIDFDLDFN